MLEQIRHVGIPEIGRCAGSGLLFEIPSVKILPRKMDSVSARFWLSVSTEWGGFAAGVGRHGLQLVESYGSERGRPSSSVSKGATAPGVGVALFGQSAVIVIFESGNL
jgi:hypothetical protein